jgi:2-amino-4-hydroxy-6-hydroxymethyldihydropteridine diphosphokinase
MSLTPVFLGLGSNSARVEHLCAGLDALQAFLQDLRCSPVFESEAVGIKSPLFFNLVVSAQTGLSLAELDQRLKAIESANGRYAPERKALPLDIDVLTYGDQVGDFAGLQLPRPEILRNAFVLWPLALLAPAVQHPQAGQSFAQLWEQAQISQRLWPVSFIWNGEELTPPALRQAFPAG